MQSNIRNAKRRVIFIIPAYNESQNLPLLFSNLKKYLERRAWDYKIIIVDDGSTDDTAQIVESFNYDPKVRLTRVYPHRGVAEAFRMGFKEALQDAADEDIIVTKEADNTSDLSILEKMVNRVDEGYDLVLASCYAKGGCVKNTTFDRLVISKAANLLVKTFLPIKNVNTYSSFYRAYRPVILHRALKKYGNQFITEENFSCMVEMLVKFSLLNIKIAEVPMVLKCDFRKGKSKINKIQTILGYFRLIARILINSKQWK